MNDLFCDKSWDWRQKKFSATIVKPVIRVITTNVFSEKSPEKEAKNVKHSTLIH